MGCLGPEYKQTSVFIVSPGLSWRAGVGDGREEGEACVALVAWASNPGDNWKRGETVHQGMDALEARERGAPSLGSLGRVGVGWGKSEDQWEPTCSGS